MEVRLLGTGSCLPEKIVTNDDLSKIVDTNDEWIASRTGIRQRRIATTETLISMSVEASKKALSMSGILAEELDMIIVATLTPDHPLPNTASEVQAALGASNAVCFDLSAACSGFLFSLNTAAMYIRCEEAKHVLVIGAEVLSKIMDWTDRSTCVLFGDGAGAAVLGASEEKGYIGTVVGSDGQKGHTLTYGGKQPIVNPFKTLSDQQDQMSDYVWMDGQEVFKFAVTKVPESIKKVLEKTGMTVDDIDHFVLHQANRKILSSVARRIKVSEDKFIINMDKYGNTSAASIPIALDELIRSGKTKTGDTMLLSGFGGGLTWGSTIFRLV